MDAVPEQRVAPNSWLSPLQLVTNLAVVLGILVLIFELNQTRNLALLGETPQESIAKAIFSPNEIGTDDVIVLSQYYNAIVVSWRRLKDDRAIRHFGGGWEEVVTEETFNFNTEFGRNSVDAHSCLT